MNMLNDLSQIFSVAQVVAMDHGRGRRPHHAYVVNWWCLKFLEFGLRPICLFLYYVSEFGLWFTVSVKFLLGICCKLVVLKISGIWTVRPICLFLYYVSKSGLWLFLYYVCLWTMVVYGLYF
jgi:hypothetical protein